MSITGSVREWYNARYEARGEKAMRPYDAYPRFLDDIEARAGRLLLDVGCGPGQLLAAAQDRGLATVGVDISDEAAQIARHVSRSSDVVCCGAEKLPFADRRFDYVTCLGALEHFADMGQALREMRRVAKPDARFCIMVPNRNFLYWRLGGRRGREQNELGETLLSCGEWRRLFESCGFRVLSVRADHWPICKAGWLYRAVWACLPMRMDYTFVYVMEKDGGE